MVIPVYRRLPSALHTARAGIGASFCAALALPALLFEDPVVLAGALAATVLVGLAAGVGSELARFARLSIPLALLVTLINPLVFQEGQTVIVRGGELLGRRLDITLEATAYGAVAGLRVVVLGMAFALFTAAIDPDEMLRLFRRLSYRSALTAALATRLVPVLGRDAVRRADAARCRREPPGRLALVRAALTGALDRAVDVAAALEARGYAGPARLVHGRRPWSRHDLRIGAGAFLIAVVSAGAAVVGGGGFDPYPRLTIAADPRVMGIAIAIMFAAIVPFVGSGARLGVARG